LTKFIMMRISILIVFIFSTFSFLSAQDSFGKSIEEFRVNYLKDFLEDERAPLKDEDALSFVKFFKPNKKYAVEATFEKTPKAKPFDIPTFSGISKPYIQYGWLNFSIDGKDYKLAVYQNLKLRVVPQFRDYLFLPFKDETNANGSYGGGRYLDVSTKDIKDGKMTLDFNKAYNPWCAYSDGYSCPIPPRENHLKVKILAGEKEYGKSKY